MDCVKLRFGREEDLSDIDAWSPKKFTCSFCKREFRSAQALGGHMNVHRRDRARLRLLPPNSIFSSASNPNPNNPSSYFSLSSPSSSPSSLSGAYNKYLLEHEGKNMMMFKGDSHHQHHPSKGIKTSVLDYGFEVVKKDEKHNDMIDRGDLYMGLVIKDPNYKEEVDSELRLGHL